MASLDHCHLKVSLLMVIWRSVLTASWAEVTHTDIFVDNNYLN